MAIKKVEYVKNNRLNTYSQDKNTSPLFILAPPYSLSNANSITISDQILETQ
jgi:hypothetical protein